MVCFLQLVVRFGRGLLIDVCIVNETEVRPPSVSGT